MLRKACLVIAGVLSLSTAWAADRPDVQFYGPGSAKRPFSEAVRVGNVLYLSGQIGIRTDGQKADIEEQTKNAMDRISQSLAKAGSSLDAVFKCTIMLADMNQWEGFNKVYASYFKPERLPARSAFQVAGLFGGAAFEMECMAYAPASR